MATKQLIFSCFDQFSGLKTIDNLCIEDKFEELKSPISFGGFKKAKAWFESTNRRLRAGSEMPITAKEIRKKSKWIEQDLQPS